MNILIFPVSSRDHMQGSLTAPITLVQYGDYQCPHCAEAYLIIQALQQQLGEQLCFVYRHFPCHDIHPDAQHAAEAAEAAGSQDRFWQMHDCLYRNYQALSNGHLVEYASGLDLDVNQFLREVTGDMHVNRIQQDLESGKASGVSTTPAFFINNYRYNGSLTQDALLTAIELVKQ